MDMWQQKAANKMERLINNLIQAKKIEYTGSMLAPETLDVCSDVDMNVYLPADTGFEMETLINKLKDRYDSVFGYETHILHYEKRAAHMFYKWPQIRYIIYIYEHEN